MPPRAAPEPDPRDWPAPWPAFWAKVPPHPALVLTYLDLGLDLLGRGEKSRSRLWRDLIHDLGWSGQNRIAFWPMAIPKNGTPSPHPALFRQGVRLLAPKCVAFFGEAAAAPIAADPASLDAVLGVSCCVLPDPAVLLQGDKEDWDAVLTRLGSL